MIVLVIALRHNDVVCQRSITQIITGIESHAKE